MTTTATPGRELLAGDELAQAHELLRQCGYDFSKAHPESYRKFSYVKFFALTRLADKPVDGPWQITDVIKETGHVKISGPGLNGLVATVGNGTPAPDKFLAHANLIVSAVNATLALSTTREPKR